MLSLGMVFLLATREIDLSVGWMFNFSAVVAALLMTGEVNPWLAAIAGVGFGALLGLVDGVLAIGLGLPAIIVTLGTYSMFEGLSLVANHGRAVFPTDQSSSFFAFASMKMFRIVPVVVMLFVALPVVLRIVLTGHASVIVCRLLEATRSARFAGIPIAVVRLQTLVLMGGVCGLSGAMYVGFRRAIDPQEGADFALIVIAFSALTRPGAPSSRAQSSCSQSPSTRS